KVVDASTAQLGDTVAYTVTVTNAGTAAYTAASPARLDDDMSDVLDDATYLSDASASWGELDFTAPTLRWAGPLAACATVPLTCSGRLDDSVTGAGALHDTVASLAASNCAAGSVDVNCRAVTQVLAESVQAPTASGPLAFTGGNVGR